MGHVEYDSNNSGGEWWLSDQNWKDLEAAGWIVEWKRLCHIKDDRGNWAKGQDGLPILVEADDALACKGVFDNGDERFLGALATKAYRKGLSLKDAVAEWERVTGLSSTSAGCPCCGQPHYFKEYDDAGKCIASGPDTHYDCSWD